MTQELPAQRLGMLKRIRKRKLVLLVDVLGEPKRDTGALEQVMRCASLLFGIDNGRRDSTVGSGSAGEDDARAISCDD